MNPNKVYAILERYIRSGYWPDYELIHMEPGLGLELHMADSTELQEGDEDGLSLRRASIIIQVPSARLPIETFRSMKGDPDRIERMADAESILERVPATLSFDLKVAPPSEFPVRYFVNVYSVSREYGGPEEGGWYYDQYLPERSYPCVDKTYAESLQAKLEADYKAQKPEDDRTSVIGTPDWRVCIEQHPALPNPMSRPHYE